MSGQSEHVAENLHATNLKASVRLNDGRRVQVLISQLSYKWCELTGDDHIEIGEEIEICVHGMGIIRARVNAAGNECVRAEFIEDCPV